MFLKTTTRHLSHDTIVLNQITGSELESCAAKLLTAVEIETCEWVGVRNVGSVL
jgi:hypothetical protein